MLLIPKIIYVAINTNTNDITISKNYSVIRCSNNIKIVSTKSARSYENETITEHKTQLQDAICSLDKSFDSTDTDRVTLFAYTIQKLKTGLINRPDIALYFYKKIIEANPNDALSLYIKEEKLNENNNQ